MKRILSAAFCLILLLSLFGCTYGEESIQEPVAFFYLRSSYVYGSEDGVVTSEVRESSGHGDDLRYMLALYLQGPLDTNLSTPFPTGCRIVDIEESGSELTVTLSPSFSTLQDLDLSLACVCLARTCMSLTDVQTVHIKAAASGTGLPVSKTINTDSLLGAETLLATEANNH